MTNSQISFIAHLTRLQSNREICLQDAYEVSSYYNRPEITRKFANQVYTQLSND